MSVRARGDLPPLLLVGVNEVCSCGRDERGLQPLHVGHELLAHDRNPVRRPDRDPRAVEGHTIAGSA